MSNTNPASTPDTWFYWVAYAGPGSITSAGEIRHPGPLIRGEQMLNLQEVIARSQHLPTVVITSVFLLRVEDADGRVIQP